MLIAVSGSQGTGKSTLIGAMKVHGINTIERKTSRSILEDWGVSLHEINSSVELTKKFQIEIADRKFRDEQQAVEDDNIWITERTYADLFTYALVNLGKDNGCSDWVDNYYDLCKRYQQHYHRVFYISAGQFQVTNDGVRGSNQHYSRMVDLIMRDYTNRMTDTNKVASIDMPEMELRVSTILKLT